MITIDLLLEEPGALSRDDLDRWIANDWVRPDCAMGIYAFSEIDIARIRLIQELRDHLDVNEEALPIVLLLLDQLYDLRRHLNGLTARMMEDRLGAGVSRAARVIDLSGETLPPV